MTIIQLHVRQVQPDGSVEFICSECESHVFCAVDDGFDFPICMECRWFGERPQVPRQRGSAHDHPGE